MQGTTCAYSQDIQGTSMASPDAVGVAALIVGRWAKRDREHGGLTPRPAHDGEDPPADGDTAACPSPPLLDYTPVGRPASYNVVCEGKPTHDNIWGHGIVDALTAVTDRDG